MHTPACKRQYVVLRGSDSAEGIARMEQQNNRIRVKVRTSGLPKEPVRALLLAGGGAVVDLGLVQQETLYWEGPCLRGGYHTLALTTDWPQPRLVLWGAWKPCLGRTPGSIQEEAAQYLRYPARNSAPAPMELPKFQRERSVLMLRHP